MNCYVCLRETGSTSRPACALCHSCGGGICEQHVIELMMQPVVGLVGDARAFGKHKLICSRCYTATISPPRPPGSQKQSRQRALFSKPPWWSRLWWHRRASLQEPEEIIAAVERFLKRQQSQ